MGKKYRAVYGGYQVVLEANDTGMKELLIDEEMFLPTLLKHADESEARAQAVAASYPERDWVNGGSKRRTGKRYTDSFEVEFGVGPHRDGTTRVYAKLINTNPFAIYIEYGNSNIKPARRILRTASGINRFDAQGDVY